MIRFGLRVFLRVVVLHTRDVPRVRHVLTLRVTLAESFLTVPPESAARTRKVHFRFLVQESLESRALGRVVSRVATPAGRGRGVTTGAGGAWGRRVG